MTRYLLATASVHTTAAAADYLDGRLDAGDAVVVLTVTEPELADRDAGDAVNVARSRLLPATVEVRERDGDPAEAIRRTLSGESVDELLIGPRRGDPTAGAGSVVAGDTGAADDDTDIAGDDSATDGDDTASDGIGSTTRELLGTVDVPVVVVPVGTV